MSLVVQKDEVGCGLACISMMTGVDYDKVKEVAANRFDKYGMTVEAVKYTLKDLGFKATSLPSIFNFRLTCILLVPSLNMMESGHYIFYSPQTGYLDPNTGRDGKEVYDSTSNPQISKIICLKSDPETIKSLENLKSAIYKELKEL